MSIEEIISVVDLPVDVWTIVCKNLKPYDIINLSKVNVHFDQLLRVGFRDHVMKEGNYLNWTQPHGYVIGSDGWRRHYRDGVVHHNEDLPSVVTTLGTQIYCKFGQIHRDKDDQPAIVGGDDYQKGWMAWMQNGKEFRENGKPVEIFGDGRETYIE